MEPDPKPPLSPLQALEAVRKEFGSPDVEGREITRDGWIYGLEISNFYDPPDVYPYAHTENMDPSQFVGYTCSGDFGDPITAESEWVGY